MMTTGKPLGETRQNESPGRFDLSANLFVVEPSGKAYLIVEPSPGDLRFYLATQGTVADEHQFVEQSLFDKICSRSQKKLLPLLLAKSADIHQATLVGRRSERRR